MDDLLDLDFSTSQPPTSQPQSLRTNSSSSASANYNRPQGLSTFDYLSQARTSSPSLSPLPSRTASPFSSASTPSQQPKPAAKSPSTIAGGDDAFSSLFGGGGSNGVGKKGNEGLSLQERIARENGGGSRPQGAGSWGAAATGSRVGDLVISSSPAINPSISRGGAAPPQRAAATPDPWDFDLLAPTSAPTPAPPTTRQPSSASANIDLFSDDSFDAFPTPASAPQPRHQQQPSEDTFDILGALSSPAPPPSSRTPQPQSRPSHSSQQQPSRPPTSRSPSPPPHVLGQIVEMGFSITQAKLALVATQKPNGEWNVERALDVLVGESAAGGQEDDVGGRREEERERDAGSDEEGMPKFRRDYDDDDDEAPPAPRRRPPPTASATPSSSSRSALPPTDALPTRPTGGRRAREAAAAASAAKVQEQAAELLAQASKIGFSVFKSANAYWETGRAVVQKKIDESMKESEDVAGAGSGKAGKARVTGRETGRPKWMTGEESMGGAEGEEVESGSSTPVERNERKKGGRPKWMTEGMEAEDGNVVEQGGEAESSRRESTPPLFMDSDEERVDPVLPSRPSARKEREDNILPSRPPARKEDPVPRRPHPVEQPAAATPPTEYRSPWRRPKVSEPTPTPPAPTSRAPPRITPIPKAKPKPTRPPRSIPPTTPAQIAASSTHKAAGNDHFKLGRFSDAEASYSRAIESLPESHPILVPLYNNRAAARLKHGDERGASEDCTICVVIILGPNGLGASGERLNLDGLADEEGVNMREQLGKALGKRAKAFEVMEKWEDAERDWKVVMEGGEGLVRPAGGSKLVSEGLARCRKMLASSSGGNSNGSTRPAPTATSNSSRPIPPQTKPKPRPQPPVVASGAAVAALRTAATAQSAEDDLRLSLKDAVDSKILAWKGGKETNLRALIASLDNVLWPELEWKKVGLHELVTESQVKIKYVRAIAKLHPDKLSVGATTVEQRMVGGSVFAALNEAWNAKK
ncbi:hypothetical protein P7C70_g3191, partial [Phenoliferia sp. Uapishka_3]